MPASSPVSTPKETTDDVVRTVREPGWDVVVWNDPVSLMSYVVLVFRRLFGFDFATATKLMLQVHHEGKAIVATQPREQAEASVSHLHAFGLQATLARN